MIRYERPEWQITLSNSHSRDHPTVPDAQRNPMPSRPSSVAMAENFDSFEHCKKSVYEWYETNSVVSTAERDHDLRVGQVTFA